jgi:hypothetical protein
MTETTNKTVYVPGEWQKPELDYAVVCDDVRFEVGDRISLMGLFDAIAVQSFPTTHPRLAVVVAWAGLRGEAKSEIDLVDPTGTTLGKLGVANLKESGEKKGARHIAVTYNVPFRGPGTHQVKIYLNGELIRSIPLPVRLAGTSQAGFGRIGSR